MPILLDSNFIFALIAKKDKYHKDAKRIFDSDILDLNRPIYTSNLIISETYTLAMIRTKRDKILLEQLYSIIDGKKKFFEIIYCTQADFQEIYKLFMKFSSKTKLLSFIDASLIFLKDKLNCNLIVSFDNHFDGIFERIC